MRMDLLAECVSVLSQCDVDDPKDQQTISMCENYILESYKLYLESCDANGYEPVSETVYMQQLMLNEGFFKKFIKGLGGAALLAGSAVAATKGINAVNANARATGKQVGVVQGNGKWDTVKKTTSNFIGNAQQLGRDAGGFKGTAKAVAGTSLNNKVANQQYAGAERNTNIQSYYDPNKPNINKRAVEATHSMSIASTKDAREAVNNNTNLQGSGTVNVTRYNKQGEVQNTKTYDRNSEQGQQVVNGAEQSRINAENKAKGKVSEEEQNRRKEQSKQDKQLNKDFNGDQNQVSEYRKELAKEKREKQQEIQKNPVVPINQKPVQTSNNKNLNGVPAAKITDMEESINVGNLNRPLTPAIKMPARMA